MEGKEDTRADERAKRITEAIEKRKLSYPELEKLTGIPKSSLQRYATGETKKIPIDCIEKIAAATGTDPVYLMGWDYTAKEAAQDHPLVDAIMAEVETLDEAEQEHLLHHIRSEKSFKQKTAPDGAVIDK